MAEYQISTYKYRDVFFAEIQIMNHVFEKGGLTRKEAAANLANYLKVIFPTIKFKREIISNEESMFNV